MSSNVRPAWRSVQKSLKRLWSNTWHSNEAGRQRNEVIKEPRLACLLLADIVAKVPKGAAANFPPKNETSDNRRPIGFPTRYQNRWRVWRLARWSLTSLFNRSAYGSENLSPTSQKTFATISALCGRGQSSLRMSVVEVERIWLRAASPSL